MDAFRNRKEKQMKAVIEFDLTDTEDNNRFKRCGKSLEMAIVIFEFLYNTRKELGRKLDASNNIDNYETIELVYEKFRELLEKQHIDIDDLIE